MEDYNGYETVRERLILAGISELQKHSMEDLSLRQVARACNVSCAAPYKHFASKQEFLSEIVNYVNLQWTKLRQQVMEVYASDEKAQVAEVCIAYIRFCMANPNFRNIMVMTEEESGRTPEGFYFSQNENLIRKYCIRKFGPGEEAERKVFLIHCIVYGTTYMFDTEHLENSRQTIDGVRKVLLRELE